MASKAREKIKLISTGKKQDGRVTGTFYTKTKNKRTSTTKLSLKKFDSKAYNIETGKCGMHVVFKEGKIK